MPTKSIAIRLPDELYEYLVSRAENEHRTLSNIIIYLLYDRMIRDELNKIDRINEIRYKLDRCSTKLTSKIVLSDENEKQELLQEKESIKIAMDIICEYGQKLVSEQNKRDKCKKNELR